MISMSLPSLQLLPMSGEVISVYGVIGIDDFFCILLNLHSYPCSVWDITLRVSSYQTRQ